MASCSININGKRHGASTAVFNYVDSTDQRSAVELIESLDQELDVKIKVVDGKTVATGDMSKIADELDVVNKAAVSLYSSKSKLFNTAEIRKVGFISEDNINQEALDSLMYMPKIDEDSNLDEEDFYEKTEVDVVDEVPKKKKSRQQKKAERIAKVFGVKGRDITLVENMIVNLKKEINRLSTGEQTEETKASLYILENLKKQLSNAESSLDLANAYTDFVFFAENTARFAKKRMAQIRDNYSKDYKSLSESERLKYLQEIFELKQSIDAFYSHESEDTSLLNLMQIYIDEIGEDIDVDARIALSEAIQDMSTVNKRYLDIGIPIQADYLMQFVPDERINSQLRARIADIKKSGRLNGLRRKDPRYLALYTKYVPLSQQFRQAVLDLNVLQLEEQIVGRDSIIRELREAHRDPGFISTYMDPLIYSSEVAMQAFAISVKNKLYDAHDQSLETKYLIRDGYYKFRDWKGTGEDNVAKLNEDMLEEVTVYIYDSETNKYIPKKVWSFVQEYDVTAFESNKNAAFEAFKKQYEYPENASSEELQEYFDENPNAELYMEAVARWYEDNTEPISGALNEINKLERQLNGLLKERFKLQNKSKPKEKDLLRIDRLTYEISGLSNELRKISRGGVPIGKLTRPNESYKNPKFKNMPAEAKEYYDQLLTIYKTDQQRIGRNSLPKNPWENFSYIIPSIRKSTYDTLLEKKFKSASSNMFTDAFLFQETDTDFGMTVDANGEKLKSIPQYYTNLVESNLISQDITASILKFNDMANRFKAKSEISGVVNIMRTAVANRQRIQLDSQGNPVLDSVAKKLGINKIVDFNNRREDSNALKQLESFIDNVYYGISDKDEIKFALASKLSRTKLSSALATLTAVTTLSGSYMQGINQLIMDSVQGGQEAWAGQFYNNKDLWWAKEKLYNVFNGNLLQGGSEKIRQKFAYNNKLNQFLEMFDAFQSFGRDSGRETGSFTKKSMSMDSLFLFQNSAEYVTTAERALALAHSYEGKLKDSAGKVIMNDQGKPANLWDVLIKSESGKLIVDPKVANFKPQEFQVLLHGILKRTNQLKGDFDKPLANRYAVGRLLTLFRSYFMPGWRKRFGHGAGGVHIDVELGQITEGYYQTFANNIGNALYDFRNLEMGAGIKHLFGVGEDEISKQNRARLLHEIVTIQLAAILAYTMTMMAGDDDDEGNMAAMVSYQMFRLRTELTSFRSPQEFFRLAQSPSAAATPIKHWAQFITSTFNLGRYAIGLPTDETTVFYQRRAGRYEKGDLKWWKEFYDVLPGLAGFLKSQDPKEALKFYE